MEMNIILSLKLIMNPTTALDFVHKFVYLMGGGGMAVSCECRAAAGARDTIGKCQKKFETFSYSRSPTLTVVFFYGDGFYISKHLS